MKLAEIFDGISKGKQFQWLLLNSGWTDIDYSVLFNKLSMNYTGEDYDDPYIRIKSDFNVRFDKVVDELKDYVQNGEGISDEHKDTIDMYLEKLEVIIHTAIDKGEIK